MTKNSHHPQRNVNFCQLLSEQDRRENNEKGIKIFMGKLDWMQFQYIKRYLDLYLDLQSSRDSIPGRGKNLVCATGAVTFPCKQHK